MRNHSDQRLISSNNSRHFSLKELGMLKMHKANLNELSRLGAQELFDITTSFEREFRLL